MNVLDVLNDPSVSQKAVNIVCYFKKSVQEITKIKEAQQKLNFYIGKVAVVPLTYVVTRWWSTLRMCDRIKYL